MAKEMPKVSKVAENAGGQAETGQNAGKEKSAAKGSVYTAGELAANAGKLFGTRQECVMAALKSADKQECTVSEAGRIVEKYLKREVQ